ncbi:MAG: IGHMBP2 family helicase [Hydrogenimonas sp.]|nr:IGHMBP2 family helicase [Hydrogenimonas sp.]
MHLKRLKIKPSNIAKTYEGDGWLLCIPNKKSFFKLPKEMIPSRELEHRIKVVHEYIEEYKALIDIERRTQMDAQVREIRLFSGAEREIFGRAVLGLKGRSMGTRFDLFVVRFSRDRIIETEIGSGDIVLVSRGEPLKSDLSATVTGVFKNFIEVAFSQKPPVWVKSADIRLDHFVNDVTFKRMEANLESMRHAEGAQKKVRDIALGLEEAKATPNTLFKPQNDRLNDIQKSAVSKALSGSEVVLIHGPPGTGKTTTLIEIIVESVKMGKTVLAAADSNVAVDNMLRKLSKIDRLKIVRIGHPARVDESLEAFTLHSLMEKEPGSRQVKEMLKEVHALVEKRNSHSKPTPSRLRGMSKERVKKLAAAGKSFRGVDQKSISSMALWIKEDEKTKRLFQKIRKIEESIVKKILRGADVVLSTNGMVGSEALEGEAFDLAVIDEASQQMEPSTLLPMMRAEKVVLAGDHKQLPPTVLSGLDILKHSLFERLMKNESLPSTMLQVQYRMNETIMDFPNRLMYSKKLIADPSVANSVLELKKIPKNPLAFRVLDVDKPLVFVDISPLDPAERLRERTTSYENETEAAIVVDIVESLIECGIGFDEVGVITPYLAQVKLLRRMMEEKSLKCEIKSVDGFQGREKEVIIISLVRSNIAKEIGFVKDARRLNVAMTRAKKKLIMVGDTATLEANDPFNRLFEWLRGEPKAEIVEPDEKTNSEKFQ